jgi:hypothetical protein
MVLDFIWLVLSLLLFFILQAAVLFALTAAVGLVGSVLSVPLLYVLPDVRRALIQASGGQPDAAPWRVAFRPRYLLGSALFGVVYGLAFIPMMRLLIDIGLFPGAGEPTPIIAVIPLTFGAASGLLVYAVHRYSAAWTEGTSARAVLVQWAVFLTVVVTVGTGVALIPAI